MAQAIFSFPRGFLWGTATSSHQVEGNNTNNTWWDWEHTQGKIIYGHQSGLACDWWGGRWREDFDRAAEAGQTTHRLSIEWSRIQPAPDRWDEDALDHYRQMVRGLHERGLIPMVTLHHFSDPLWLMESGGWEQKTIVNLFEAYTRKVVEALKVYVPYWVTINEPSIYTYFGYYFGIFPPGEKDLKKLVKVIENMVRSHSAAYRAIHSLQPSAKVGLAHHYRGLKPIRNWFPLDRWTTNFQSQIFNGIFPEVFHDGVLRLPIRHKRIPEAKGTQDFFGLNYYTSEYATFNLLRYGYGFTRHCFAPDAELSCSGFLANEPLGMYEAMQWSRKFKLPMIITENGVEDSDDRLRPKYLLQHLHQVWRAANFNWPVMGYYHWSLVDNFEWERGWTQRFGLWELDVETQARRKRPSVDLYAVICRENAISSDLVERYAPQLIESIFPG
jgi:beta-glucosidase